MTRIPPLDPDALDGDQRAVYDELVAGKRGGVRGPFPALLQIPQLAQRVARLGDVVRFDTTFAPAVFEVTVLTTARGVRCIYEWYAHSRMARQAGVSPEVIEAIRVGEDPPFADADQRLAHTFAAELINRHRVTDATYEAVRERFGQAGAVELAAIVGYFAMVATSINAHELGIDPALPDPFEAVAP